VDSVHELSKGRARRFRDKAEELKAAANDLSDEQCRSMLLKIARDYSNLADAAETRSQAGPTVCAIEANEPAAHLTVSRSRRGAS
jgi:hypothetical protein